MARGRGAGGRVGAGQREIKGRKKNETTVIAQSIL